MAAQVKFCIRGGVHGFVWPQLASGWTSLSDSERMEGNEVILSAGKGGSTAIVIGVQSSDPAAVSRYAKQAEKLGADAIISLPPPGVTDEKALLAYYQEVGRMTNLPLFAQAVGAMSVDLLVEMFKTIPTMRYVKDEAGVPLERIADLRQKTGDQLKVFSGNGAGTMISEMERGFSGACPYTSLADVFAASFDLWHKGRKREALRHVRPDSGVRHDYADRLARNPDRPRRLQAGNQEPRPARVDRRRTRRRHTDALCPLKKSARSWMPISSRI